MRKVLLVSGFWLILTPILLEVALRVATPALPPALRIAAERVERGEATDINRINLMMRDRDHNFVMKPDIEDELYGSHQTVVFNVSTVRVNDSYLGFRTRPVEPGESIDVVTVGDSFTFCFTEFADCWVTQFENATGLRTLNLGQGSTGSVSHWRFIDQYARPYEPPLVIWQFFVNDFNEDYQLAVFREEMPPAPVETVVPDYDDGTPGVVTWLRENSVAWVVMEIALFGEDAYISDFERYHFTRPYEATYTDPDGVTHTLRYGQQYEQIATNMNDPRISSGVPLTTEALRDAQATVEGWGGQLVVILIPTREEVYRHLTEGELGAETVDRLGGPRRTMLDICDDLSLTCLDLLPGFQAQAQRGEHLYYTEDMHLNPYGNTVLTELVVDWLRELGLVE